MINQNISNWIRIWILSVICAILLFSSADAMTITASPNPAAVGKPVAFTLNIGDTGCTLAVNFGDGGGAQIVSPNPTVSNVFTIQHTYSRPGLFTVTLVNQGGCTPDPPSPASTTIRVSDFNVNRIELKFDNQQPQITVKRNQEIKGLSVKINYTGSGFLKGYWEVDGQRRSSVFRHVLTGPYVVLDYPKIPPLPTFTPGTHRVRFVVTHPYLNIDFPSALYFVRTDPDMDRMPIRLVLPERKQLCDYAQTTFIWKKHRKAVLYNIRFYKADDSEVVFSAYSRTSEYTLQEKPLNLRFFPGGTFKWQVFGLNKEEQIVARSDVRPFSFSQFISHVPDLLLLVTIQNPEGLKLRSDVVRDFNADIVEEYGLKTLGMHMTTYLVRQDIFKVMEEVKKRPGIILAQPSFIYTTFSEPLSDIQMLSRRLNMDEFKIVQSGKDVSIGIIDTAVDIRHRDIEKAVIFNGDFIEKGEIAAEIHGTAVAGLIAARVNFFGIQGVAPGSGILALRACKQITKDNPKGECYSHSLIKALDTALQQKADIVNLSLGFNGEDVLLSRLIDAGVERGVLFVAPAGNSPDSKEICFPASHPDVISVGGQLPDKSFYPNSVIAEQADMMVSCKNILTTVPGDEHNFLSGTSMSSAIVSGVLALCREADPSFSLEDFRQMNGRLDSVLGFLSEHKKF